MKLLKSISHKIVFSLCLLLAIISIYIYKDYSSVYHVSNEAIRIKFASQLRFRAYEMGWLAQRIVEREVVIMDEETRKGLVARLKSEIASFERILKDLKDGNSKEGLEKLTYRDAIVLLDSIYSEWSDNMKPALVQLSDTPSPISEKQARKLLEPFDNRLTEMAYTTDMLVAFLDDDYRNEIREYKRFRLYIFGFFLASATLILLYVNRRIVRPVKSLQNAAKEIAKGNYDVHVDVKTTDEIGEFGQAFNRMANEISAAFGEILWHSEDVMALNRALNKFVGLQKEEDMYKVICEHARELFGLKMSWLGLLNEENRNVRLVANSGADAAFLSSMTVKWDGSVYGMGPEGIAIKTNLPQIINDMELADTSLPEIREALRQGYLSCMAQPLICANCAVIGVMVFYSEKKDHFTADMAELCQIFVNHAASVIENVILLKDLEDRVQERTEKLQDALLLAQSANMAKSDFLANMSHDLRTPLNTIIGFSEALSQGIYGEMKDEHREYVTYIYQSGIKLLKLINEVLDLSKMESRAMELEYVESNFSDILNNALYIFREKIKKHGIEVSTEVSDEAKALVVDQNKIKQVIVNLMTDSIRATPDRGKITIKAEKVPCSTTAIESCSPEETTAGDSRNRSCIEVSVTDTRPGLSSEDRLRFFEPYKQFDATVNRKQESISLLLSKRFIEMHGGRIWAEAPAGPLTDRDRTQGNRFVFILPQRPCHDSLK
jgi:signal transduction histidine kinase